ncbi:MAG: cytochrome c [Nitrospirae bacterium]|nr:cytochrome c [Nitrospirota bacterium]
MRQYCGLTSFLCLCAALTVVCLGVVVYAADRHGLQEQLLHGREVFEQNCIMCHGVDAKGTGQLAAALPVRPADLTNCKLTDEDPVLVGQGIIRHGGPYTGRSSGMPAFGTVLSNSDIVDVARYVRSLCADPEWVSRELDFPHPLITSKAFPEQHMTVGGGFGRNGTNVNEYFGLLEYRVNGLTNIGIKSRVLSINPNIGTAESGLGDSVLSVNRVVAFSPLYRALASVGLDLALPTGNDRRGLGDGSVVFEPSLRAGVDWKRVVVQAAGALVLPAQTSNINSEATFNVAIGRYFFLDPRLQITPMIELNTTTSLSEPSYGETKSAILPLIRVKWLRWALGVGVQAPITDARDFEVRPLFDLIYDY